MNEATDTVPPASQEIKFTEKNLRNFWRKVDKNGPTQPHMETPCWVWTAAKNKKGYGNFGVSGRIYLAHRLLWIMENGAIIQRNNTDHRVCVCHRCDNPACCRTDHLFLGTNTDNVRDMEKKGRARHPRGDDSGLRKHPERAVRGEAHAQAKLTDDKVIYIRTVHAAGSITQRSLAAQFGVTNTTISHIIKRKIWKHVA